MTYPHPKSLSNVADVLPDIAYPPHLDLLHQPKNLAFGEATHSGNQEQTLLPQFVSLDSFRKSGVICIDLLDCLGTRNPHGIFWFRLLQAKPLGVLLLAKIAWRVSLDEAGWINEPVQRTTLKDLQPKKVMLWNPQIPFWTRILGLSTINCYP